MAPRPIGNSERVNVFFSPETLEQLQEEARKRGTTTSGIIRMIVLDFLEQKK